MENDLISRSALLEKAELIIDANYDDYIVVDEEDIKNAPAVDAVEVVRCRDCKHFTKGMAVGMCKRVTDKPVLPTPHNHFCSYGERREENGNL